jgi:hypothetical protein
MAGGRGGSSKGSNSSVKKHVVREITTAFPKGRTPEQLREETIRSAEAAQAESFLQDKNFEGRSMTESQKLGRLGMFDNMRTNLETETFKQRNQKGRNVAGGLGIG